MTDDAGVFAEHALPLLRADPVANTIALSILDWLLSGRAFSSSMPGHVAPPHARLRGCYRRRVTTTQG